MAERHTLYVCPLHGPVAATHEVAGEKVCPINVGQDETCCSTLDGPLTLEIDGEVARSPEPRLFTYREAAEKCLAWMHSADEDRRWPADVTNADVELLLADVRAAAQVYATLAQAEAAEMLAAITGGEQPRDLRPPRVSLPGWIAGATT